MTAHGSKRFLQDCGVKVPKSDVHDKLRWCLQESGSQDLEAASRRLDTLRAERNKADYDLDDAKFKKVAPARIQVKTSRANVAAIDASRVQPHYELIRDRLREYAENVLRWPVV